MNGSGVIHDKHGQEYQVTYNPTTDRDGNLRHRYDVTTHHPSFSLPYPVGGVHMDRKGTAAMSVGIDARYQRRGVATALYAHIEKHLGKKLQPNSAQTDDGIAFWKSRTEEIMTPSFAVVQVAAGRNPLEVLESAFALGWNQFVNHYDKNGPDAHGPDTNTPVTSDLMHFPKVTSGKVPKQHTVGHCYQNALANHKKHGLKMVVGFAVPKAEIPNLQKHGKLSWNPLYRGYEHAWNLDKEGGVVDSTYHGHSGGTDSYEYHGKVVPPQTSAGFKNDADVQGYVQHVNSGGRYAHSPSYVKHIMGQKDFATANFPPKAEIHNKMTAGGWEHHSSSYSKDGVRSHIYIHPKWGKANLSTKGPNQDITSLSREYSTPNVRSNYIQFGGSPSKYSKYGGTFGDFFLKHAKPKE